MNRKRKKNHRKELLSGSCDVYDAVMHRTNYVFDENQRIKSINRYHADQKIYTHERLYWGAEGTPEHTCLLARTLEHVGIRTIFARTYKYDSFGNVTKDTLYGNLSGNDTKQPAVQSDGTAVENGGERYSKESTYSTDGFNLLLSETDGISTTTYKYIPETNLLEAKFEHGNSSCRKRYFYTYDDNAALTLEIVDDGFGADSQDLTGVTERYLTYYKQNQIHPVAYPIEITSKYLDIAKGTEHLIHRVENKYNNLALIEEQRHYNSSDALAYTLTWEYDFAGNPVKEVDAIGRTILRKFDNHGNCLWEQGPHPDCQKNFTYDCMNRLVREEEIHADGATLVTSHRYDFLSNRVATVDPLGNETKFRYDPFGRVVETIFPQVLDHNGQPYNPVVTRDYDPMGNVIKETNAKGIEKNMRYTVRGQLSDTSFADGTSEYNRYQSNGVLAESKARNGTVIRYTNDSRGRPIKAETFSADGELLTTTSVTYSSFHKLTETDAMGIVTEYTYYPNGKEKSVRRADSLVEYSYDSLGNLKKTTKYCGNYLQQKIIEIKNCDLLGRVVHEVIRDGIMEVVSNVFYVYDIAGNIEEMKTHSAAGSVVTLSSYDSHGIARRVVDAEGNETRTTCDYNFHNALGQRVLQKTVTDPMGNLTIVEMDTLGRVRQTIRKDRFGKITQHQEQFYDATGNCCRIVEHVIAPDGTITPVTTLMEYDTTDHLIATTEAYDTPEQKTIKITYNKYGQKQDVIKADGVVLTSTYDPLGRLLRIFSSDNTIDYTYHYDLNNNPLQVDDNVHNTMTKRIFDNNNQMTQETLANGYSLQYTYDRTGRPLKVTLPDASAINYTYYVTHLKSVARTDFIGNPLYTHTYVRYDKTGKLLDAQAPGKAGPLNYVYDRLGRPKSISASNWKETIASYDAAGNILENTIQGEVAQYTYDTLYQLTHEGGGTQHDYTYDSQYNRRTKDGTQYTLNQLNQITGDGTHHYTYDRNGNLKEKSSPGRLQKYTYDAWDRLITYQDNTRILNYFYDDTHRRLTKSNLECGDLSPLSGKALKVGTTTHYLYQGQDEIGAMDANGNITQLRILGKGLGAEIGAAVAMEIDGQTYVPIHDHRGNVSALFDLAGNIVEEYRYTAYGEELFEQAISPWRFSSKRIDEETGYIYFGRRYYDSLIGRWLTPDPIGREGGPNLYAYVLNNPLTHFDLYGLSSEGLLGTLFTILGVVSNTLVTSIECIGNFMKEQLPIPLLRDGLSSLGHFLRNGTLSNYKMEYSGHHSCYDRIYGLERNPKDAYAVVPGVLTPGKTIAEWASTFSRQLGLVDVYYTDNATHGLPTDLGEVLCQKIRVPTNSVQQCAKMVREMFSSLAPDGRVHLYGHSQGGLIIDSIRPYFSAEELSRIDVVTFGSATIIESSGFGSVKNYVSLSDPVPFLADPVGIVKSLCCKNYCVEFLPSNKFFGSDHGFEGETYQNAIRREIQSQRH